jgi:hypothetical protein
VLFDKLLLAGKFPLLKFDIFSGPLDSFMDTPALNLNAKQSEKCFLAVKLNDSKKLLLPKIVPASNIIAQLPFFSIDSFGNVTLPLSCEIKKLHCEKNKKARMSVTQHFLFIIIYF